MAEKRSSGKNRNTVIRAILDHPDLLNIFQDGMVIVDQTGIVRAWNAGMERFTGIPASEAIGAFHTSVDRSDYGALARKSIPEADLVGHLQSFFNDGKLPKEHTHYRTRMEHRDGVIYWVDVETRFVYQEGKYWLVSTLHDITGEVAGQEALEQIKNKKLEISEALHSVTINLTSQLSLPAVIDGVLDQATRLIPYITANLMLMRGDFAYIAAGRGYDTLGMQHWQSTWQAHIQDFPILRHMSSSGEAVLLRDTHETPYWKRQGTNDWIRSYLGAPLIFDGKALGFINFNAGTPDQFTEHHLEFIQTYAQQAAIAVRNAQLYEETTHRAQRLELLNQVVTAINQPTSFEDVLAIAGRGLADVLGVSQTLVAIHKDGEEQFVVAADNPGPKSIGLKGRSMRIDASPVFGALMQHKRPLMVVDVQNSSLMNGLHDVLRQRHVISLLLIPILVKDKLIGLISVDAIEEARHFNLEEIHLANTVASLVGLRYEQTRLLEKVQNQNQDLAVIRQILDRLNSSEDVEQELNEILSLIQPVFNSDRITVILFDQSQQFVRLITPISVLEPFDFGQYWPINWLSSSEDLLANRIHYTPKLENELVSEAEKVLFRAGFLSRMNVPLHTGGKVIGSLNFIWKQESGYQGIRTDLVIQISDALSLAIERSRLFQEASQREQLLHTLASNIQKLLASSDLKRIIPQMLAQLGTVLGVSRAYFDSVEFLESKGWVMSEQYSWTAEGVINPLAASDFQKTPFADLWLERWVDILKAGTTVYGIIHTFPDQERDFLSTQGIKSILVLPLLVNGEWWGFLGFDDCVTERFWSEGQVQALRMIANAMSSAVERRLVELQSEQNLILAEALRDSASAISESLELNDVLDRILENVGRVQPHDAANIMLLDNDVLYLVRHRGYAEFNLSGVVDTIKIHLPAVKNLLEAAETGKVSLTSLVEYTDDWVHTPISVFTKSNISAPLWIRGKTIGFLNLDSAIPGFFTEEHAGKVKVFADQAALAIENARLYQQERERARQIGLMNQMTRLALRANTLEEIYASFAEHVARLFGADDAYLTLWDEQNRKTIPIMSHGYDKEHYKTITPEPGEKTLTESVLEMGHALVLDDVEHSPYLSPRIARMFRQSSLMAIPLIANERKIGAAIIAFHEPHAFSVDEVLMGEQLAGQIALAMAKNLALESVQQQAITDVLTGLYNRRGLVELGRREVERARRFARSLCAIMFDLDLLKAVNDQFGHPIGDQVLISIARIAEDQVRSTDLLGRYGGDEFLILLPETDSQQAVEVAERLRESVYGACLPENSPDLCVTISVGVSVLSSDDTDGLESLINCADQALYRSKKAGKNRVSLIDSSPCP